jgi:D-alanine-D-alanine ligase
MTDDLGEIIGVVTGGYSRERDGSLLSGATVADALAEAGCTVRQLDTALPTFADDIRKVDVTFLAIRGQWAEDGKLQGFLDTIGVPTPAPVSWPPRWPCTSPPPRPSSLPPACPRLPSCALNADRASVTNVVGWPLIVKPTSEGGSLDLAVAHDLGDLVAIPAVSDRDVEVFLERFVPGGRAVTVGLVEIDGALTALPTLEASVNRPFYDWASKRDPRLHRYVCPADLPEPFNSGAVNAAFRAHRALGCDGYSRHDFVVSHEGFWWLEANTLPGLSPGGNMATAARAAGITYTELVLHMLATARPGHRRYRYRP